MTKKIKGDLVMKEDMRFSESIEVEGNIICEGERRSLTVAGNIDAGNINAWNIDAGNINAWNIDAGDINAGDINAGNIDAWNIDARNIDAWNIDAGNIDAWNIDARNINAWNIIFCEKIDRTSLKGKIKAKMLIEKRSELLQKEWE